MEKKIEGYVCPVCGYDLEIRWDDVLGYDYSWYGDCEHCDYHARFKPDQQKDIEEIFGHHYFDNKHRYLDTSQKATKKEIALCLKEIKYWTRRLEVASDVEIREHVDLQVKPPAPLTESKRKKIAGEIKWEKENSYAF